MLSRRGRLASLALAAALVAAAWQDLTPRTAFDAAEWETGIDCQVVSGPCTHGNLTIFLLYGPDMHPGQFATLQEALANNWAVVHETGTVNQLNVENNSPELDIFLQAGDIVKGG